MLGLQSASVQVQPGTPKPLCTASKTAGIKAGTGYILMEETLRSQGNSRKLLAPPGWRGRDRSLPYHSPGRGQVGGCNRSMPPRMEPKPLLESHCQSQQCPHVARLGKQLKRARIWSELQHTRPSGQQGKRRGSLAGRGKLRFWA